MNFKKYIQLIESPTYNDGSIGTHNDGPGGGFNSGGGIYSTGDWNKSDAGSTRDAQGHAPHLPSHTFEIPTTSKTGRILHIEYRRNPIHILLSDGTRLYFTLDEYKRIKGDKPDIGKKITVVFQRLPNDTSKEASQIQSCICT